MSAGIGDPYELYKYVHVSEVGNTSGGGMGGMGEGGTIGAPAALANAVSDALSALDIEINEIPITPERLFQLVKNTEAGGASGTTR